jgi:hypothetical protein
MATSTDYDAPRRPAEEDESQQEMQVRRAAPDQRGTVDDDESQLAQRFEQSGTDQVDDELTAVVVEVQDDEFTCSRCFLVHHRNQLAAPDAKVCKDCA